MRSLIYFVKLHKKYNLIADTEFSRARGSKTLEAAAGDLKAHAEAAQTA